MNVGEEKISMRECVGAVRLIGLKIKKNCKKGQAVHLRVRNHAASIFEAGFEGSFLVQGLKLYLLTTTNAMGTIQHKARRRQTQVCCFGTNQTQTTPQPIV